MLVLDPWVSTPVLATKLFAPARRPQLVARPRLAEQLDATLDAGHRLTLVSAPAGFGKTTLLSDWLAHLERTPTDTRVAWLSLDAGDNDLARLLTHLVAALATQPASRSTPAVLRVRCPARRPPSPDRAGQRRRPRR